MTRTRLRYLAEVNPPTSEFDRLGMEKAVTFMPLETVWSDHRLDTSRLRPKAAVMTGYARFRDGDVLLPKVTPTFQAGRSTLVGGLHNGVGAGSTELHVLRARDHSDARFVCYATQTSRFIGEGVAAFKGVAGLQRVPENFVRDFEVPLLALDEQQRIADFLDDQVSVLDRTIDLRHAQEGLFSERFQSWSQKVLIEDQSLHPRRPLGLLCDPRRPIQYGIVLPGPHFPGGVPIIKGGDVGAGRMAPDQLQRTTPEIDGRYARSRVTGGDLVISIRGSYGELREVPPSLSGANLTQDSARIAPCGVDREWLHAVLETPDLQSQMAARATGAMVKGLNIFELRRLQVPTPDSPTQIALGRLVAHERNQLRRSVDLMCTSLSLLREQKQALITSAVMGQFDVTTARGVA